MHEDTDLGPAITLCRRRPGRTAAGGPPRRGRREWPRCRRSRASCRRQLAPPPQAGEDLLPLVVGEEPERHVGVVLPAGAAREGQLERQVRPLDQRPRLRQQVVHHLAQPGVDDQNEKRRKSARPCSSWRTRAEGIILVDASPRPPSGAGRRRP